MKPLALDDVIAALATPRGNGALAVIRVSGAEAIALCDRVFRGRRTLTSLEGYRAAHGWIHDGDGPVDEVVAWVYRAPHSFTGDDMIELTCHGGTVSVRRLITALVAAGARPAEAGEFTRRAFLNGRMDLTQAEAVADLIAAGGRRAQEQALAQLQGGLRRRIEEIADPLRAALVDVEAYLDFGEDVPDPPAAETLASVLTRASRQIAELLDTVAPARAAREGFTVALAGKPNVGKSSLLNRLLGADRAIVHAEPGTTRDVVDAQVEWAGIPVRLVDTAGLRAAQSVVEVEGIERSRAEMGSADLVLWVVDGAAPRDLSEEVIHTPHSILVMNKADLGIHSSWLAIDHPSTAVVSALIGDGVSDLVTAVCNVLSEEFSALEQSESAAVTSDRQAQHLHAAAVSINRAADIVTKEGALELLAADVISSLRSLADVAGGNPAEEVLDAIFSKFCIGK